jgi:ABC-type glycerol-3-phosphate transport system substrate-binding protein
VKKSLVSSMHRWLIPTAVAAGMVFLSSCSLFGPPQPTPTPSPSPTLEVVSTPPSTPAPASPEPYPYPLPAYTFEPPTPVPTRAYPAPGETEPVGTPAEVEASPTASPQSGASPTPQATATLQVGGYPPPAGPTFTPPVGSYPGPSLATATLQTGAYPPPPANTPSPPGGYPPPGATAPAVSPTTSPVVTRTPQPTFPAFGTSTPTPGPGTVFPTPTERPVSTAMPPPRPDVATISIWHSWSPSERQTLEEVTLAFQQVYPDIYFEILYVPIDQLRTRYEAIAYSGGGPDLVMGPAEWGPSFYDMGLVADLSAIATREFLDTINQAALGQARYGSALIGLPHTIRSGVVLYRNQTIIPDAPETYADLVSSAQAAARPGVIGAYLDRSFYYSAAHLYGLGGRLANPSGNPSFNSLQGREWVSLLVSLRDAGPVDFNTNRDLDYFRSGRSGFLIDSTAHLQMLAAALGDDLVIDPWPSYKSGHLSGFVHSDLIFLNGNLLPEQRYDPLLFMGFMLSPEVQTILTRAGHTPAVAAAEVTDKFMQQAVQAFAGGSPYPVAAGMDLYSEALDQALISVFSGQEIIPNALQRAHRQIMAGLSELRQR